MYLFIKYSITVLSILNLVCGARILGIFFYPSYSHQIVFNPIYRELSKRGHEVIVVTPNPLKDLALTNLTEIDISYLYKKYNEQMTEGFINSVTYPQFVRFARSISFKFMEEILKNEEFKKLYQNSEIFDLVMVEAATPMIPAFGHLFKAPTIGVYSLEAAVDQYTALGGIIHPVVYGGLVMDFEYPISMWHKIQNTYNFLWHKYYIKFIIAPVADALSKKYLGKNFPSLSELNETISMLFVTKNPIMTAVRPMPPSMVQLDFMHIQEPKPLPKDLEHILNASTRGVAYFSLGSNVKSSKLSPAVKEAIIKGLSSLPYTVLWKWESDDVPGTGNNVITRKWFPQQDILAHPNVKVFITQGGMQSTEEAISKAVPLVGIPIMGDQEDNVKKLVKLGVAIRLSLNELTSNSLKRAIIEVAENKKYSKRIKELRDVALDQPMTGIERAVWWSEYVIRNKGAPALRSVLADVPLYEYLMLDVIAVVLFVLVVFFLVLIQLVAVLSRILASVSKKKKLE